MLLALALHIRLRTPIYASAMPTHAARTDMRSWLAAGRRSVKRAEESFHLER